MAPSVPQQAAHGAFAGVDSEASMPLAATRHPSPLTALLANPAREVGCNERPLLGPMLSDQLYNLGVLLQQKRTAVLDGAAGPPSCCVAAYTMCLTSSGTTSQQWHYIPATG